MEGGFTEKYVEWFDALPPEVARELAVVLARFAPGGLLESSLITADPLDGFSARIRRLASDPARDAGTALMLGELTDLAFIDRGDPKAWAKNEQMLEVLDEANKNLSPEGDEVSEDLSEWIEQNRLRYPLRSRQWLAQRDGWRTLRASDLSTATIHATLGRI